MRQFTSKALLRAPRAVSLASASVGSVPAPLDLPAVQLAAAAIEKHMEVKTQPRMANKNPDILLVAILSAPGWVDLTQGYDLTKRIIRMSAATVCE
jgi:hypothetical protein